MKIAANIAGALLGLMFVAFSIMYFVMMAKGTMPNPGFPPDSAAAHFMAAVGPTGYMNFVKCCELLGGLLVIIPRLRNFGLLLLGPVIVNILCFHTFITKGVGLADPTVIVICLLALFLLWSGRKEFGGLLR